MRKFLEAIVVAGVLVSCTLVGGCAIHPRPIDAASACYLRATPMPIDPFSSSGDYRAPDSHCILQLPQSIVRGGTISVAPEAFAAAQQ